MALRLHACQRMRRPLLLLLLCAVVIGTLTPASAAAQGDCITLDDFSKATVGQFPSGWKPRKDEGTEIYKMGEESGLRFLRAVSRGDGIQAAREIDAWDLAAYPVLAWSWRPREFPKGANEKSGKNDSVLAVY